MELEESQTRRMFWKMAELLHLSEKEQMAEGVHPPSTVCVYARSYFNAVKEVNHHLCPFFELFSILFCPPIFQVSDVYKRQI